ncbi:MAG: IS21 family transposase, partial [Bacteroidales bacterium]|nr:IS21 family transposase [Bacteroidales bacterium]
DMGNHYGFVVIPCQPAKPTQKSLVENQVQMIYHRIYARLQHRQFFSLEELNMAVYELLVRHNRTRMQQRAYTREEHFHAVERMTLKELPETPYLMKRYADVTVQQNGHVYLSCDKHYYSVPYTLIGCTAKIIFTSTLVKVFVKGNQVAVHKRVRGYGYTSLDEHLASNTLAFTKRSASYYVDRAKSVSEALCALIEGMFAASRANCPPEYYYKTCDMMLRLQRDYNPSYFDKACEICLENSLFTGKKLENVIKTLMQATPEDNWLTAPDPTDHANMRGSLFFQ